MAKKKPSTPKSGNPAKRLQLGNILWMATGGTSLLGLLAVMGLMMASSHNPYREDALESGKRVEFIPATGVINGKLLRLEDIAKLKEAESHPLTKPAEEAPKAEAKVDVIPVEQETAAGIIPVIAENGTMPWQYFANKMTADIAPETPMIAIIVTGLGMAKAPTEAALRLAPAVTLAFTPYGDGIQEQAALAQKQNHETLLSVPMQTQGYPASDPGAMALLSDAPPATNQKRAEALLPALRGYVGMVTPPDEILSEKADAYKMLTQLTESHGLILVSGIPSLPSDSAKLASGMIRSPFFGASLWLDQQPSEAAIRAQMNKAESIAKKQGRAIVIATPQPITLDMIHEWQDALKTRGFALVPITALAPQAATTTKPQEKP